MPKPSVLDAAAEAEHRGTPSPGEETERRIVWGEVGTILGRPVEDRSFEVVETSLGAVVGAGVGTVIAGPVGTLVGGVLGGAAGIVGGEAVERAAGPAATRTDAEAADLMPEEDSAEAGARAAGGRAATHGEFISYPTNRLLAVADTMADADAAVEALSHAGASFSDVVVIAGADAARQLGRLGQHESPFARLVRLVQFTTMDQMPDFRVYEAALQDGRAIVSVRVPDAGAIPVARDALLAHGLHFLNFYGRWSTAEITPWRGPELDLPEYLRR